eukprot:CAMPEP_0194255584 /NCGR_PEP_ID=MMETSP0158-20130606/34763_1 /TAXON_ID=33649 /ORGANISM="Thalassionema nitzschioides, Strain L26-B" /LENGTH=70 /DNA_ID=CAMNT_0038993975 /DNA_START=183 /DNA_END=395 /DNA_ORIENTATION=+
MTNSCVGTEPVDGKNDGVFEIVGCSDVVGDADGNVDADGDIDDDGGAYCGQDGLQQWQMTSSQSTFMRGV